MAFSPSVCVLLKGNMMSGNVSYWECNATIRQVQMLVGGDWAAIYLLERPQESLLLDIWLCYDGENSVGSEPLIACHENTPYNLIFKGVDAR